MTIKEKRSRVRELKNNGTIPDAFAPSGVAIVSMTVAECDHLLGLYDPEWGESDAGKPRTADNGAAGKPEPVPEPVSGDPLTLAIASAIRPHLAGTVDQAEFDKLAADSRALASRVEEIASQVTARGGAREMRIATRDREPVDVGMVHWRFPTLLSMVEAGLHVYLPGPAGSFKTSTAGKVAEALGLECGAISVCQQTTAVSLLGYTDATGNYVETEFRRRYEHGGVFILDEIDNGNANVLAVLNSALANGSCAFPDGMVTRHSDFRLIATANTFGMGGSAQYVGRCQLDAATLDRFAFLEWPYDEALEETIALGSSNLTQPEIRGTLSYSREAWVAYVRAVRNAVAETESRIVVSPRATFMGIALIDVSERATNGGGITDDVLRDSLIWKGISREERERLETRI